MDQSQRSELLDCPFDAVTMQRAVDECIEWCRGPRAAHTVVTLNAAILCMMRRDAQLREACHRGDLIVLDGMPLVWTARLSGISVSERVTGVDMMGRLLAAASERRLSVYFLGARPETLARLAEICTRAYPGLVVAGARHGYFAPAEHAGIVYDIRHSAPHILFVGLPSPFKETWCERHREALKVPVIMGVGGSFDVIAGQVRRAPALLQSMGMEFFWRIMMEPRRMWKRYLATNPEFLWLAAREILRRRLGVARRVG